MKLEPSLTEMDSKPELRSSGKKLRKRRELDALISRSMARKCYNQQGSGGVCSQDKLLSASTDDPDDYSLPKVTLATSAIKRKYFMYRMCAPLLVVTGIALSVGFMSWLYFDMRQEIYDYRRKINEVSATSQDLPETLQKWHETTTLLFKNHTSLLLKIRELQVVIDSLRQNMSECRSLFDTQQNYAKVEKVVADFGANIEAVVTDIDGMKSHYSNIANEQKLLNYAVTNLKANLSDVRKLASEAVELPLNYSKEITTLKSTLLFKVNALVTNLTVVNDTLSQKSKLLNDELVIHKEKLDELFDHSGNVTSHVTSIENALPVVKKKIVDLEDVAKQLDLKIASVFNQSQTMEISMKKMCTACQRENLEAKQTLFKHIESTKAPLKLFPKNFSSVQNIEHFKTNEVTTLIP